MHDNGSEFTLDLVVQKYELHMNRTLAACVERMQVDQPTQELRPPRRVVSAVLRGGVP